MRRVCAGNSVGSACYRISSRRRAARRGRPGRLLPTPCRTRRRARGRTGSPRSVRAPRARPRGSTAPIGAVRRHRVERVGDAEHARLERDVLLLAAGGVAGAVPALVVVEDDRQDRLGRAERAEHARAGARVTAHQAELGLGQRARLEQHRGRYRELPDVVQQRAQAEHGDALGIQADPPSPSPARRR